MSLISARNLTLFRLVTFATTILFSVIVISLCADLISLTHSVSYTFKFSGFSLATGLISLLTVAPIYVIEKLRKGSFFSYIVVEIVWLSVLWIFWLTSGSYAAWTDNWIISRVPQESSCNFGFGADDATRGCHEIKAIAAFSFLLWILLMGYTIMLIVLCIRAHQNGQSAWKTSVCDGTILSVSEKAVENPTQVVVAPPSIPQSYPPASQQTLLPPASRGVVVF